MSYHGELLSAMRAKRNQSSRQLRSEVAYVAVTVAVESSDMKQQQKRC